VDEPDQYLVDSELFSKVWDATAVSSLDAVTYMNNLLNSLSGTVTLPLISHSIHYYDGTAFTGLPYGEIGAYGVHIRTESLVITDAIITDAYGSAIPPCFAGTGTPNWSAYPGAFVSQLQSTTLGYTYQNAAPYETGYYLCPSSSEYDFQDGVTTNPRGLLLIVQDTFGNQTTVAYDTYDFLPLTVTDPVGMQTAAQYDYRVLAPNQITDPNGNRVQAAYSPLGLLYKTAVMGKTTETKGDTLANPTTLLQYDFFNWMYNSQPIWVQTSAREQHYYDNPSSPYLVKTDYSDGFGRLIQSRAQAEDTLFGAMPTGDSGLPASQTAPNANAVGNIRPGTAPLNVVVSGWQVFNNKGKVVEKFEPFFDSGFDFVSPGANPYGQKVQLFYDARGILIRTLHPDGTEERLVLGIPVVTTSPDVFIPTPWVSCAYDANDMTSSLLAYGTPRFNYLDPMGRTIRTYEKNIYHDYIGGGTATQDIQMLYEFDIRGNLLQVTDALGRVSFTHVYDLANRPLRTYNIDKGVTHAVPDALNKLVMGDDAKGGYALMAYDVKNRLVNTWAIDNNTISGLTYSLRNEILYGDTNGQTAATNMLGKVWTNNDEAGTVVNTMYDFKGNLLTTTRQVIDPVYIMSLFPGGIPWDVTPFTVDWSIGMPLDATTYQTDFEYDALNRITQLTYPAASADGQRRVMMPTYDNSGALASVDLQETSGGPITNYVRQIAYNAMGQKLLMALGNEVMTRYVYDAKNFRLLRMKTEKYSLSGTATTVTYTPSSGSTQQDFGYTYDALGNILSISDQTPNGGVGGATGLTRNFDYDALYRILTASGRESGPTTSDPYLDDIRGNAPVYTRAYTQNYDYDQMGNIQELNHNTSGGGSFNRIFNYTAIGSNNALGSVTIGGSNYPFAYDPCGNQILQNTSCGMYWDWGNRMKAYYNQVPSSEPSTYSQYLYDIEGKRIMKITRVTGGNYQVRIYINGIFEEYYEVNGGVNMGYQDEMMIMDNKSKIASELIGASYSYPFSLPFVSYIFGDNLGSSNVLINATGSFISREEYYPFGETSFGSYAKKRYRFCGKEKDEESGLYYYGARYYMPWTCRFISIDPLMEKFPFYTPYQYAGNKPINFIDLDGKEPADPSGGDSSGSSGSGGGNNNSSGGNNSDSSQKPVSVSQDQDGNVNINIHGKIDSVTNDAKTNTETVVSESINSKTGNVDVTTTSIAGDACNLVVKSTTVSTNQSPRTGGEVPVIDTGSQTPILMNNSSSYSDNHSVTVPAPEKVDTIPINTIPATSSESNPAPANTIKSETDSQGGGSSESNTPMKNLELFVTILGSTADLMGRIIKWGKGAANDVKFFGETLGRKIFAPIGALFAVVDFFLGPDKGESTTHYIVKSIINIGMAVLAFIPGLDVIPAVWAGFSILGWDKPIIEGISNGIDWLVDKSKSYPASLPSTLMH